MSTNLSKIKRDKMLETIAKIKESISDDETLKNLSLIEYELTKKKYGLIWEEHEEKVDEELKTKIPTFEEVKDKEIFCNEDEKFNFLLEGDNLHSLYLLEKTHKGKIDIIYIDPPYNTGNKDFIYNDLYVDLEDGYRHSKWLSFMEKRLKIAYNLLSNIGVIFISIDNYEQAQLKLLCDEIFGEQNFIECAIVKKSENGKGDKKGFANNHDYLLCYQKTVNAKFNGLSMSEEYISKFNKEDEYGKYRMDGILMKKGADSRREDSPTLYYPLYYNAETGKVSLYQSEDTPIERYPYKSDGTDGRWTWSKNKVEKEGYRLFASKNATIYIKDYLSDDRRMKIKSILEETKYLNNIATNETTKILGKRNLFSTPKPVNLIKDIIDLVGNKESIILDYFAGSGTTAQSVYELNEKDNGHRRFILCTNNENGICENITYKRIKNTTTANVKYYRTTYVPRINTEEENIQENLLFNIKNLIQLENGINIDDEKIKVILAEEEVDKFSLDIEDVKKCERLYISSDILLTAKQTKTFKDNGVEVYIIPEYYFENEIREVQ